MATHATHLRLLAPGNPNGRVMPLAEWKTLFEMSDRYGFVITSDECYSEIYFGDGRPLGALQAVHQLGRGDYRNLVARRRAVTLVGVGRTLREWQSRLEEAGMHVTAIEAGRPRPGILPALRPRSVLVFGVAPARERWRGALQAFGMREMRDFVFAS